MSGERSLIDANVLVYAFYADAEQYLPSRNLLDAARRGELQLCVTSQVLAEFFSIITSPKRVSIVRTPHEALEAVEMLLSLDGVTVLPSPPTVPALVRGGIKGSHFGGVSGCHSGEWSGRGTRPGPPPEENRAAAVRVCSLRDDVSG